MATKGSKGSKLGKDGDKRGTKKMDDLSLVEEKKEESTPESEAVETPATEEQPSVETVSPVKEPTPEPVYDDPVLSEVIVERYEGEKARGFYEGEGRADFAGGHCYIGEFSEGLMHGKGTYVWANDIVYEGNFYKNEATGKGIYRWPDGSAYDGDLLNGKRHGFGTYRNHDNSLSYTGDWCQGKRHGKGRMDYNDTGKSFYDGDWVSNIRHGYGLRQYPSLNRYQGMWFNNVRHGEGTMSWLDKDQSYTGQWENGIQHGLGQHTWVLQRITGSQYPLRNMYDGEVVNGLRNGIGTFYYANGAKYAGYWKNNMKHGKGKFTFKNGRVYEGLFEKDHIVEFPDFIMDGMTTPDLTDIRTRTPIPHDLLSLHSNESRNTISPSFQLEIEHLLVTFPDLDREEELNQVMYATMRHITSLRRIYNHYSSLGHLASIDNAFIMDKMQFWRLLKDCYLDDGDKTLMDMDRIIGRAYDKPSYSLHNPKERILLREFINYLVVLAFHLFHKDHDGDSPMLASCMRRLMQDNILPYACQSRGHVYYEGRRAHNALVHVDQAYEVYQEICTHPKKKKQAKPKELSLKMRQFLFMMKDMKLINSDLTVKRILEVLSKDTPKVADGEGNYSLEIEMTFLEFFEALVGCAEFYVTEQVVKDPATPCPSTILTRDHSFISGPASPSRHTSQLGGMEEADGLQQTPHGQSTSPALSLLMVTSSGEGIAPTNEVHASSGILNPPTDRHHDSSNSLRDSLKEELSAMEEQQKSTSFVSNRSNGMEEHGLVQSSVSLAARTDEEEVGEEVAEEEEVELDEATRRFNFWTHQIHIFFVRKFFPVAERLIALQKIVDKRNLDEMRLQHKIEAMSSKATPESLHSLQLPASTQECAVATSEREL